MLSIIICSIKPVLLVQLKKNIDRLIGIEYEIISIDNSANKYSLSEAYNLGASKAQFNNLLFLHEDVKIHTPNWGQFLIKQLSNSKIGLIGISGAVYKSKYPSTWSMIPKGYYRLNSIQQWQNGKTTREIIKEIPQAEYSEVAVIDGVFMAMQKAVWKEFPFDETNLKGFHFYDLDSSLRIGKKYKIVVSHQILLEHFSEGNLTTDWITGSIAFHKRYKNNLPVFSKNISKKEQKNLDYHAITAFIFVLIRNNKHRLAIEYYLKALSKTLFSHTNLNILKLLIKTLLNPKLKKYS